MAATKDAGLPPVPKSGVIRFLPSTTAAAAAEEEAAGATAAREQQQDKGRRGDEDDDLMEEDGEDESEDEGSSGVVGQQPSANEVCGVYGGVVGADDAMSLCAYIQSPPSPKPPQQLEEAVLQTLVDLLARDVCHQVLACLSVSTQTQPPPHDMNF